MDRKEFKYAYSIVRKLLNSKIYNFDVYREAIVDVAYKIKRLENSLIVMRMMFANNYLDKHNFYDVYIELAKLRFRQASRSNRDIALKEYLIDLAYIMDVNDFKANRANIKEIPSIEREYLYKFNIDLKEHMNTCFESIKPNFATLMSYYERLKANLPSYLGYVESIGSIKLTSLKHKILYRI